MTIINPNLRVSRPTNTVLGTVCHVAVLENCHLDFEFYAEATVLQCLIGQVFINKFNHLTLCLWYWSFVVVSITIQLCLSKFRLHQVFRSCVHAKSFHPLTVGDLKVAHIALSMSSTLHKFSIITLPLHSSFTICPSLHFFH